MICRSRNIHVRVDRGHRTDRARQDSLSISQSESMIPQEAQRHSPIMMLSISEVRPTHRTLCSLL